MGNIWRKIKNRIASMSQNTARLLFTFTFLVVLLWFSEAITRVFFHTTIFLSFGVYSAEAERIIYENIHFLCVIGIFLLLVVFDVYLHSYSYTKDLLKGRGFEIVEENPFKVELVKCQDGENLYFDIFSDKSFTVYVVKEDFTHSECFEFHYEDLYVIKKLINAKPWGRQTYK